MSIGVSSDANASIFLAALQGICANPNFFGPIFQQSPNAAVEFAQACVRAAYGNNRDRQYPNWIGEAETEAEEAIRDILSELEDKTGKSIDAVTVDTRDHAAYRTEITFR